jgi:hypothetical protein
MRATEAYFEVRRKDRKAAGADAAALECRLMDELKHWTGSERGRPLRRREHYVGRDIGKLSLT